MLSKALALSMAAALGAAILLPRSEAFSGPPLPAAAARASSRVSLRMSTMPKKKVVVTGIGAVTRCACPPLPPSPPSVSPLSLPPPLPLALPFPALPPSPPPPHLSFTSFLPSPPPASLRLHPNPSPAHPTVLAHGCFSIFDQSVSAFSTPRGRSIGSGEEFLPSLLEGKIGITKLPAWADEFPVKSHALEPPPSTIKPSQTPHHKPQTLNSDSFAWQANMAGQLDGFDATKWCDAQTLNP